MISYNNIIIIYIYIIINILFIFNYYILIYRSIPRVLTIYDMNMDPIEARKNITELFRKNMHIKDKEFISILIAKGY